MPVVHDNTTSNFQAEVNFEWNIVVRRTPPCFLARKFLNARINLRQVILQRVAELLAVDLQKVSRDVLNLACLNSIPSSKVVGVSSSGKVYIGTLPVLLSDSVSLTTNI